MHNLLTTSSSSLSRERKKDFLQRQLQNSFAQKNRPFESLRVPQFVPKGTSPAPHCEGLPDLLVSPQPNPTHKGLASSHRSWQHGCHSQMDSKSSIFPSKAVLQPPLQLFSPAKLNLFFRVLYKREDGFHEIASLYQAISLGDTLTISLAEEDRLTCNDPRVPCDSTNLISKALEVFRRQTGYRFNVHIHLEKKVPMQAGLGGGSSNAATALWAFNALSPRPVPEEELCRWVATFSSDAPFFFSNGTAYCTGRGEEIHKMGSVAQTQLWIAKPDEGLSTPLVYQHCSPSHFPQRDPDQLLKEWVNGTPRYFNDLEIPAFGLMPRLAQLKEDLKRLGFSEATMTGSGTAFFCTGACHQPQLPGVQFYPAAFHYRSTGSWYEFPEV